MFPLLSEKRKGIDGTHTLRRSATTIVWPQHCLTGQLVAPLMGLPLDMLGADILDRQQVPKTPRGESVRAGALIARARPMAAQNQPWPAGPGASSTWGARRSLLAAAASAWFSGSARSLHQLLSPCCGGRPPEGLSGPAGGLAAPPFRPAACLPAAHSAMEMTDRGVCRCPPCC